jgi:hypothetical protein
MGLRHWTAAVAVASVALCGSPSWAQSAGPATPPAAGAPNAKSEALVRRYFAAIKFEALMNTMMASMIPMMTENMAKSQPGLTTDQRALISDTVTGVMRDVMLPKMMDRMVPLYAQTYSQDELEAIVAFYESPAGRAITEKTPSLAPKTTEVLRELMPDMNVELVSRLCAKIDCRGGSKPAAAKPRAS